MKLQPRAPLQSRAPRQPRAPLPRDIHYCHPAEEVRVFSGLAPRWRLLRACQKGIACPRCGEGPCLSRPVCLERLWAYAAQRRREKYPLPAANIEIIRKTLKDNIETSVPMALDAAIDHGLVRLERIKDSTEVQWVDAV